MPKRKESSSCDDKGESGHKRKVELEPDRRRYSVKEVCELTGRSKRTIERHIHQWRSSHGRRGLKSHWMGGRVVYHADMVDWLKREFNEPDPVVALLAVVADGGDANGANVGDDAVN